jgi:pimeloyl-ACP methyl ester carboxylesterase
MTGTTAAPTRSTVRSTDGTPIAYASLGTGRGVIVVGGALRTSRDYLPLARELAKSFAVHVMDRRGRGASGPQGAGYGIDKEFVDLLAVQAATGATAVFGHSFGGLVALETARRAAVFSQVAVYEPGVSVDGSLPVGWMPRYRELLAAGDTRGAFASMVRQSGFGPSALAKMPLWYLRLILRLVIRRRQWQEMEPLLEANLAENEQVERLDEGTVERYSSITARVLLLGGGKSPPFITTELFDSLQRTIPDSVAEILDGLGHTAPDEKAPEVVAERVRAYFCLR